MTAAETSNALVRHAADCGDWRLAGALARFLELEPAHSMIAACCSYITLCERLGIDV
jgi:hypothetical protein